MHCYVNQVPENIYQIDQQNLKKVQLNRVGRCGSAFKNGLEWRAVKVTKYFSGYIAVKGEYTRSNKSPLRSGRFYIQYRLISFMLQSLIRVRYRASVACRHIVEFLLRSQSSANSNSVDSCYFRPLPVTIVSAFNSKYTFRFKFTLNCVAVLKFCY